MLFLIGLYSNLFIRGFYRHNYCCIKLYNIELKIKFENAQEVASEKDSETDSYDTAGLKRETEEVSVVASEEETEAETEKVSWR